MEPICKQNQNRKVAETTNKKPNWGPHPPRRLRKAKTIWDHMKNSGRGIGREGYGTGPWFTAEMLYVWYNENYRYDITVHWLGNVLSKNRGVFVKGPDRTFAASNGGGKRVALWRVA